MPSLYFPNPNPDDGQRQSKKADDVAFFARLAESEQAGVPAPAITSVSTAHAAVVADLEADRLAAEAEVKNAKERLERAYAVVSANPGPDADADLQKCLLQNTAAGPLHTLAKLAVEQAAALAPAADEIDKLRAAGASVDKFNTELAPRVAAMRTHLSAFAAEVKAAFDVLAVHQAAGSVVASKLASLADKLLGIRTTADIHQKLGRRFLTVAGHDAVQTALVKVLSEVLGMGLHDATNVTSHWRG